MRCFPQLLHACAWLFCVAVPALSQVSIDLWTTENGLPQNIIRGICQTPDGYLWLATFDGLVRFDGVRFRIFNRGNTPEIKGNRFGSPFCSVGGDFWAGTEGSGVTRYREGRFRTYTTREILPSNDVLKVTGDDAGHIWALSGSSIVCWDEASARFTEFCSQHGDSSFSNSTWFGWIDRGTGLGNAFWGLARDRLRVFFPGHLPDYPLPQNWPSESVIAVAGDLNGTIWLAGKRGRLAKLDGSRWSAGRRGERLIAEWTPGQPAFF